MFSYSILIASIAVLIGLAFISASSQIGEIGLGLVSLLMSDGTFDVRDKNDKGYFFVIVSTFLKHPVIL